MSQQMMRPYDVGLNAPNALPAGHWANARMPYAPGMSQPYGGMVPSPTLGMIQPLSPVGFGTSGGYRPMPMPEPTFTPGGPTSRPPMPFSTAVGGVGGGGMPFSTGVGGVASGAGGPQATVDPPMMGRDPNAGMRDMMFRPGQPYNPYSGGMREPGGALGAANGMPQDPAMQAQQHQQRIQEMQMKMQMEQMKMQEIQMKNQGIGMQAQAKAMPGLVANGGANGGGMWGDMQNAYRQGQPRALQNWNNMGNAWQRGAGRNSFQMQNPFNASYQQSLGMKPQTGGFTRSPGTPEGSLSRNTGSFLNF